MAIKNESELLTAFETGQFRGITSEKMRDFINSVLGVGGTMFTTEQKTQAVTTSWAPITVFDASNDTKGISEDLVNGVYTVQAGADGIYDVICTLSMSFPGNGTVQIALTKNAGLTPYQSKIDVAADTLTQLAVVGSGNLVEGDTVGVAIKGSGSAPGAFISAQFRLKR